MEFRFKEWIYKEKPPYKSTDELIKTLNITETMGNILVNRGINKAETAQKFLFPDLKDLHNPFLLKDMSKAVSLIQKAISKKKAIWVYGDYDVDGIASIALFVEYFKSINYTINYYIPHRQKEGYGLNKEAIKHIYDQGGHIIITVDCGISSLAEVEYAKKLGLDIIITDHHSCPGRLPRADAIINPKQTDCCYPFDMLCGCGLVLKLIQALMTPEAFSRKVNNYLVLTAIATVADIVPLRDENRLIVKKGLELMQASNNYGIKSLLELCKLGGQKITTGHVAFMIAPRLNAAGRLGSAQLAVELLIADNYENAFRLAKFIDNLNKERQEIENDIINRAIKLIDADTKYREEKVIVVWDEDWHDGVIGIVASKIVELYYKPTIVLTVNGMIAKGSARSIPNFNLFDALSQCEKFFIRYGGHEQAAGMTLKTEDIEKFRKKINQIAHKVLRDEDMIPKIICDGKLMLNEINEKLLNELSNLAPFGIGNATPRFINCKLKAKDIRGVGHNNRHLKIKFEESNTNKMIEGIGFNLGKFRKLISENDEIAAVFVPEYNKYNNKVNMQLNIKDIKFFENIELSNIIIHDKYFKTLILSHIEDICYCNQDWQLEELAITFLDDKKKFIFEHFKNINNTLILVNTIRQADNLIKLSQIKGKDSRTVIKFFYNEGPKKYGENEIHIVINPNIDKIRYKIYNSVIVYDMFFNKNQYYKLLYQVRSNGMDLHLLYETNDENSNMEVFKNIFPSRNDLIKIYKQIRKWEGTNFLEFNNFIYKSQINRILLHNALEIFEEGKLIKRVGDGENHRLKLTKTVGKVDITKLQTYQKWQTVLNGFEDIVVEYSRQIKGGYFK